MKVNKVFKAFVIVIAIITVLFATGTFTQASVLETGTAGLRAQSSWIFIFGTSDSLPGFVVPNKAFEYNIIRAYRWICRWYEDE